MDISKELRDNLQWLTYYVVGNFIGDYDYTYSRKLAHKIYDNTNWIVRQCVKDGIGSCTEVKIGEYEY
jgi:hypothetical protein